MTKINNNLRLVTVAGILVILQLVIIKPVQADFLDRLSFRYPGAEYVWRPPGAMRFPQGDTENDFSIRWADCTLARYKIDGKLRTLGTIDGPELNFNHADPHFYISTGFISQSPELRINQNSRNYENNLTGDRSIFRLEGGYNFPLASDESITLAFNFTNLDLNTSGTLESLVHGIPGLEDSDSSRLDWSESGWTVAVHYLWDNTASFGVAYGQSESDISINSFSEQENVSIGVRPSGVTYGMTAFFPLQSDKNCEVFYRYTRNSGGGGVYRREKWLGPFNALMNSREYGFQLRDSNEMERWRFTLSRGVYSESLHGSANISGFGSPVFGITSPRVHMDSNTQLSITTAMYEKDIGTILDSNGTFSIGLSRWDMEGGVGTWESYLFGSAIANDDYTLLEWESGWLAHLGFEFDWEIASDDSLVLFIGQTIPINIVETEADQLLEHPVVHRVRRYDGGRYLSLTYTLNF
ncbi:MAG: hypothetical protein NTY09_03930 [bacterium]|nr:hypothetical protein [bacterium]